MKKLLIVVDYQKDFVEGSLGFQKARELEPKICEKIDSYRRFGYEVLFTLDTHYEDYLNTQEGEKLPVKHCIYGTEGWELYGQVNGKKEKGDRCFIKSSFGSADLYRYLVDKEYNSIEIVGVVTHICVLANAVIVKTALPDTPVFVDASCVASNDDKLNEQALNIMESMQIDILNR